ncbi:MAG: ubiquinol-cytochrome c reductase cytochrome b subunit, partial [Solirubrobacteraceae bacterium]|nr:ubiquinol-cytochrome c reductase cytochrome b subunit [Solirubrobacteraceae bacterium]
ALYFDPSTATTTYTGSYAPLHGVQMSHALASTIHLSLDVKAGLLIRQTHHWAALVFVAAITLHLLRVFFTGAFRKPRDLTWYVGLVLLMVSVLEGFLGYSLPGDLVSGMGLGIAYSVALAVPFAGAKLALLVWGDAFPGSAVFESRLYIAHVLLIPGLIAALIGLHLGLVALLRHTQFPGPGRTEKNVVGTPLWPAYALRSLALFAATAAVLFALGGLVQINPVWQWGPFEPWLATNGAQPDWYLGWLIGALRIMPPVELSLWGHTIIPNPFFGGILFPSVVFGTLFLWPTLERWVTGDYSDHQLLDRPRDHPVRTALGAAFFTWVATLFFAGAADRIFVTFGISYTRQVLFFRVAAVVFPVLAFLIVRSLCRELARSGAHPLRGFTGQVVARREDGSFSALDADPAATDSAETADPGVTSTTTRPGS